MKFLKKFACYSLLTSIFILCFQFNTMTADASPVNVIGGTCCSNHARKMHFNRYESGTVKITRNNHTIYDSNVNSTGIYYYPGEQFYYDSVYRYYNCKNEMMYTFASYVNSSGVRRYIMTSYDGGNGQTYVDGINVY